MTPVWCIECSRKNGGYTKHAWPPCDLTETGEMIDPQPCGHRRGFRGGDGKCSACRKESQILEEAKRIRKKRVLTGR